MARIFGPAICAALLAVLLYAGSAAADVWADMEARFAADAGVDALLFVRYKGGTEAVAELRVKDGTSWRTALSCAAFVGYNGIGKRAEGDGRTPIGVFRAKEAFGISPNPGTALRYTQVTEDIYCCGEGATYNRIIDIRERPHECTGERLIDFAPEYNYGIFIDYNEGGAPGQGSAIFLHCAGKSRSTAGCVAVPEDKMKELLRAAGPGMRICVFDDAPRPLVLLSDIAPDVLQDIRYRSSFNFIGRPIRGYEEPIALITEPAARALRDANAELMTRGFRLKLFDAYRPQRAVNDFVAWTKDAGDVRMKAYFYPNVSKDRLIPDGFIGARSGHSRGSTVDVTLFDMASGRDADMGGGFDFFGPISHAERSEGLSADQINNRALLREVMTRHGFKPLRTEWWHFTLANEPYPDTYFDLPVARSSAAVSPKK